VLDKRLRWARLVLMEPPVEAFVSRGPGRNDGDDAAAVAQVAGGLGQVLDGRLAADTKGRIHHDRVVLVDDVMVLEGALHQLAVEHHGHARAQLEAGLDRRAADVLGQPPRDGAVAGARLQRLLAAAQVGPLDHLQTQRFGRGEVVRAFARLGARVALLGGPVEALRPVVLAERIVGGRIARLAAGAFAGVAGREVPRFLERGDEAVLQRARQLAAAEVLRSTRTLRDRRCERPALPRRAGVQVPEDGVGHLAGAVDAALLLHRGGGLRRQAQVELHPLVLAGGVVQADALLAGRRLHQQHLRAASVVLELAHGLASRLRRDVAVEQQHAGELGLEGLDRRPHVPQRRRHQVSELAAERLHRGVVAGRACGRRFVGAGGRRRRVHVERVEAATLLVVVEYHHLAAHGHVLAHQRYHFGRLDRLQQVPARQVVELVG
jgi:hypothetical protein